MRSRSTTGRLGSLLVGVIAAVSVSGCDFGVPVDPSPVIPDGDATWTNGIGTILVEHCGSCHGSPSRAGAPSTFRLDVYDAQDGGGVPGAKETASRVRARVVLQGTMPPDGNLDAAETDAIDRWVRAGAPR